MRRRANLLVICASLAALGALAGLAPAALARPSIAAFRGAGAWVDLYSPRALRAPEAAVADMARHGVRTLYLETANHRQRRSVTIVDPARVDRFIVAAHAHGMRIVAWYLPGLRDIELDELRCLDAMLHQTPDGQSFDAFALDIEASLVNPISARNRALAKLSRTLRSIAGSDYALGAIVPDARSTEPRRSLWPAFPYQMVAHTYDVVLPMAYSTHRGHGAGFIRRYIAANMAKIRRLSGRRPAIHVIGGLTGGLSRAESRMVVATARRGGAIGASLYRYDESRSGDWAALRPFVVERALARAAP